MTKQELIKILDGEKNEYILLDDLSYDPIEMIVLSQKKYKLFKNVKGGIFFEDEKRNKRVAICKTFKELGLSDWYKDKSKVSFSIDDRDMTFLWLVLAYGNLTRNSWLRRNIIMRHENLFSCDEKGVEDFYLKYLSESGLKINVINNTVFSREIACGYTFFSKAKVRLLKKMSLARMRIYYFIKYQKIKCNKQYSNETFINRLVVDGVISGGMESFDRKSLNSSSGGNFLMSCEGEERYFIKGNEPLPLTSIKNEAFVQQRILGLNDNQDKFVLMDKYADDYMWIRYPFFPYDTLDNYLSLKKLDESSKRILGLFLCECLDILYDLKIVHNDFRSTNIMVVTDSEENVLGFRLLDFGASSIDGRQPWNLNCYEGEYAIKSVCGDYRYNDTIVDDAASALLTYIDAGGSSKDDIAKELQSKIGRLYYSYNAKEM